MQPALGAVHEDPTVQADVERKAGRSKNRRTGKKVGETQPLIFQSHFGPALTMSFTAVAPPQPDEARLSELARLQLSAFFYLLSYNEETRRGGFWPGIYEPLQYSFRSDWGNAVQRWFRAFSRGWHVRMRGALADGYFRIMILRHPGKELWAWALEWNRNVRVIGFFGNEEAVRWATSFAPEIDMQVVGRNPQGAEIRMRFEVPLGADDDDMFSFDDVERLR